MRIRNAAGSWAPRASGHRAEARGKLQNRPAISAQRQRTFGIRRFVTDRQRRDQFLLAQDHPSHRRIVEPDAAEADVDPSSLSAAI